jgi:hypothetical protein
MNPPGRPKGELHRSAQREGISMTSFAASPLMKALDSCLTPDASRRRSPSS